jgi:hypothetical protein
MKIGLIEPGKIGLLTNRGRCRNISGIYFYLPDNIWLNGENAE